MCGVHRYFILRGERAEVSPDSRAVRSYPTAQKRRQGEQEPPGPRADAGSTPQCSDPGKPLWLRFVLGGDGRQGSSVGTSAIKEDNDSFPRHCYLRPGDERPDKRVSHRRDENTSLCSAPRLRTRPCVLSCRRCRAPG